MPPIPLLEPPRAGPWRSPRHSRRRGHGRRSISRDGPAGEIVAVTRDVQDLGPFHVVTAELPSGETVRVETQFAHVRIGERLGLSFERDAICLFSDGSASSNPPKKSRDTLCPCSVDFMTKSGRLPLAPPAGPARVFLN
ncbi:TOBE domain-containing protein [Devosia psychrophila]|uniref:TOBE domain-containing protein n=1 Tax=Devosia psychrophila TaxID=728005 RepID=UPI000942ABCB